MPEKPQNECPKVLCPNQVNEKKREIQTKMTFGDTEIKIAAKDMSSGRSVRAEIDFLTI